MKVKVLASPKYQEGAKKEIAALIVGVVAFIAFLVLSFANIPMSIFFSGYSLLFRIPVAIWVYFMMGKLNRDQGWSAFAALLFPTALLVICGVVKKKNIRFKLDDRYPAQQQIVELRKYAEAYMKEEKYTEAGFVYKYIIAVLPYTSADTETYDSLVSKSPVAIPALNISKK